MKIFFFARVVVFVEFLLLAAAKVVKCNTMKHFVAFGSLFFSPIKGEKYLFYKKWIDLMVLMTLYLVAIATDCEPPLPSLGLFYMI